MKQPNFTKKLDSANNSIRVTACLLQEKTIHG